MKQHYCIVNDTVKENLIAYIRTLPVNPRAPMVVEAREETRTERRKAEPRGMEGPHHRSGESDSGPGTEISPGHQRWPRLFRRPHIQIQQALHGRRH